jgi:hypothetical protein
VLDRESGPGRPYAATLPITHRRRLREPNRGEPGPRPDARPHAPYSFHSGPRNVAKATPWSLLGLTVSGDLGDFTLYQRQDRAVVAYPRSPPKVPRTYLQAIQRSRFATAVANWLNADPAERDAYERATLRTALPATGHNLWISLSFSQDDELRDTISRQAGVLLTMPPVV